MKGRGFLSPTQQLILDRTDPDALEVARILMDTVADEFLGWDIQYTLHRVTDESRGDTADYIDIHVADAGHENAARAAAAALQERFGQAVNYDDDGARERIRIAAAPLRAAP